MRRQHKILWICGSATGANRQWQLSTHCCRLREREHTRRMSYAQQTFLFGGVVLTLLVIFDIVLGRTQLWIAAPFVERDEQPNRYWIAVAFHAALAGSCWLAVMFP
jgi:hypothetical protein